MGEATRSRALPPEQLVTVPCYCEPKRQHGPHQVPARRLQKGGDLRGKIKLPRGLLGYVDGGG